MVAGPAWMRRLVSSGSSPVRSYSTSRGPKHRSQTNRASSGYRSPHSLQFSASTDIASYSCGLRRLPVTEASERSVTSPRLSLGEPDGLGTVSAEADGCRGFTGPCPSTPLDANGYVERRRIQTAPEAFQPAGRILHDDGANRRPAETRCRTSRSHGYDAHRARG